MKIPKYFQILGQEIKVEQVFNLVVKEDADGEHHPRLNKIQIQGDSKVWPRNEDQIGSAYCHELVHTILNSMGEEKLNSNEKFVDLFGNLLYQVIKTSKF